MRHSKLTFFIVTICSLVIFSDSAFALGALFCRKRWSSDEYQKMWIKTISVDVDIQGQMAVTHVDQVFKNELNTSVETIYIFPLPENAMITELVYWVNGQKYIANIREKQEAVAAYNKKLRQWLDPALLEYLGNNLFRLSIVPVNALTDVRTEITYMESLPYDMGMVSYKFLLNTLDLSSKPLNSVSVNLNAQNQVPYKSFTSPSHQNSSASRIEKVSAKQYKFFFGDEDFYPDKDLIIEYETERDNVDIQMLTYTPTAADSFGTSSFYALWITPPDTIEDEKIIPKDVIFTADVSSSMEGERMEQVKEALYNFLDLLNPQDRFNIITFGTFSEKFKPDLVNAEAQKIDEARNFVYHLFALGLTNINDALTESLQQSFGTESSNNLIFLTDGQPTWGETNTQTILDNTALLNTNNVRIFPFGVGEDVSHSFLGDLAAENHGYAKFITADDSIALIVNKHYRRISQPVLQNISLDFGGLSTLDQYPLVISDLYWGTQLLYTGLYENSGVFDVALTGDMRSEPFIYSESINFPGTAGGHRFVPRLWAKRKIDHILNLIALYGENEELIEQVIELSLRFQILTPYTAFYSDPDIDNPSPIDEKDNIGPDDFYLAQNFPNPFNPQTSIKFHLPVSGQNYLVKIKIYNSQGRLIKILINKNFNSGTHSVVWDGTDINGMQVPSGVYFYNIKAGSFYQCRKMTLIR